MSDYQRPEFESAYIGLYSSLWPPLEEEAFFFMTLHHSRLLNQNKFLLEVQMSDLYNFPLLISTLTDGKESNRTVSSHRL